MTTAVPNHRASLLAGLRTGGVRSVSSNVPHTAAPGGSFNIQAPRFTSNSYPQQHQFNVFPDEEDEGVDQIAEMPPSSRTQFPYQNAGSMGGINRQAPMTAAVDGPNNRFSQQQQMGPSRGMNPNSVPFNPAGLQSPAAFAQNQALQMQLMQLEIMRLQNIQAQQYQAEALAQAQRQQQQQQQQQARDRRASLQYNAASAGPSPAAFDLRAAALSAQARKASQADQLRAQLGLYNEEQQQPPMTAGLGGRFGSRLPSMRYGEESDSELSSPATPAQSTTVISGGTSLGNPLLSNISTGNAVSNNLPSKSDSAVSWRRGGNNNSVLSGNRSVTSPSVRVTPPPGERVTPPLPKARPQPLRFSPAISQPISTAVVAVTESDSASTSGELSDEASSNGGSSVKSSGSSPTTPHSTASSADTPLSPREEAAKKLYEGLGIGRPAPVSSSPPLTAGHRMTSSQPMRQPRGPPSGTDELGPKNFASRIRRKAIGGLGALMAGRERREMLIEAF